MDSINLILCFTNSTKSLAKRIPGNHFDRGEGETNGIASVCVARPMTQPGDLVSYTVQVPRLW